MESKKEESGIEAQMKDANSCMAIGAGVGVAGEGAAMLAGATCPLCVVIAPALVGIGAWKRHKLKVDRNLELEEKSKFF